MFEKDESVKYKQGVEMGYALAIKDVEKLKDYKSVKAFGISIDEVRQHLVNMKNLSVNEYMKKYLHLED